LITVIEFLNVMPSGYVDDLTKIRHSFCMSSSHDSLQGKLILDSGKLIGSYFDRAVILICKHDESGSFGIVLNRPLKRTLGSVLTESITTPIAKMPLFGGGPVQTNLLSFLYVTKTQPEYSILPNLSLSHSLDDVKEYYAESEKRVARAYAGYAGWSQGQLDEEMKSGCWLTHPASITLIFGEDPSTLWKEILKKMGGTYQLMANTPDDPSLN
jgi:putative transcriptional regulator